MQRGDVVVAAVVGDYGTPRPAVIVHTDALPASHASVVICQMTSVIVDPSRFRITLEPAPGNGLRRRCHVMIDKPVTIRRTRIGYVVVGSQPRRWTG